MKPEAAAERVLSELSIRDIPIPVERIAEKLGVKVSYEPFDGKDEISGVLIKEGERVVIGINSTHTKTRQRFTIAHEIGHLVLKHRGTIFVDKTVRINRDTTSAMAIDPSEIEANGFAAALLMPRKLIVEELQKRLKKNPNKIKTALFLVDDLANAFYVSTQAMEHRLNNLGILTPR